MFDNFRKEVIKGAIVIIGSIIVFGVIFYFFSKSLNDTAQHIVADRLLIAKNASLLGNLAQLKQDDQEATRYEKAMEKLLVTKDQLIDFPRWLEELAHVRQVDLGPVSFLGSEVEPQERYPGYINFTLDIVGTLDALTSFLKDIELQSARFAVGISVLDVTKSNSGFRIISQGTVFFR